MAVLRDALSSHRITLTGEFAIVYGKDHSKITGYEEPGETNTSYLVPWLDEGEQERIIRCMAIFLKACFAPAQRTDTPIIVVGGHEFELGMSRTGSGRVVVVALPIPEGLSKTADSHTCGSGCVLAAIPAAQPVRSKVFLLLLLVTVLVFFTSVWLAMFLSKQITRPVSALPMPWTDCRRQI